MSGEAAVAPRERTWRPWQVLCIAVLVLWLFVAALTWWTAPRKQSYAQARADAVAGRVTEYQWGDGWEDQHSRTWFGRDTLRSSGTTGPLFLWRTADGRTHWTDSNNFGEVSVPAAVDMKNYSGAGAAALAQDLRAAGLEDRGGEIDSLGSVIAVASIILAAIVFCVLVAGPAPVLGTRWFWFWVVYLVPLGLGFLFWLVRDRPWSRSAASTPGPGGAERRDRGFFGLGIAILATILISILLAVLHAALGDRWVPSPDG